MDTIFVGQLEFCDASFAPVADVLTVFWCVLAVLATFVAGIMVGYRLGYRRGLQDGNPLLQSPLYRWLKGIDGLHD